MQIGPIGSNVVWFRYNYMYTHDVLPPVSPIGGINGISIEEKPKLTFQKMLENEVKKIDSFYAKNVEDNIENIDKKNILQDNKKEASDWNNVLTRMIEVSSNNQII